MNRIVRSEFLCPKCGSSLWGTSGCTGPRRLQRGHCHGHGCNFQWSRMLDDWRHFVFTVRPTRAEYRRLETMRLREANRDLKVGRSSPQASKEPTDG